MNGDTPTPVYTQRFAVAYEYPVQFTRHVFAPENPALVEAISRREPDRRHRFQVFVDAGCAAATPGLFDSIARYAARHADRLQHEGPPELVPGGESAKNSREAAERVMESIADHHLCRQSTVVAVGGGSALDIIGLAAALVHRGVRLVRVPTTVLAQADSGVGVKNGIDAYGVKNFAGTFAPPFAVVNDFEFLKTLAPKYYIGGLAEAYKVALIRDRAFFEYLRAHAPRLRAGDPAPMEAAVRRAAVLHLEHIAGGGDPFEFGTARPLDFGHWSAHRLEVRSGYELGHGQAVSIGMALDCCYAAHIGCLPAYERDVVLDALEETGLPIWSSLLERRSVEGDLDILRGLEEFREHLGGQLTVTLPAPIGQRLEVHQFDHDALRTCIAWLGQRARTGLAPREVRPA